MLYPLKFKPVFKDYIWGGRNLEKLNKELPSGQVAESWEISCHPDGISVVANGELKGKTLPEIIKKYGGKILGNNVSKRYIEQFPLLIKFIDANSWLSVQVHPDDDYAKEHENEDNGKNEMWYIIEAKTGAKLVYGLKKEVTLEVFLKSIRENKIIDCLNYIEVSPGDIIDIPAGMVHAIGEGIVLAEIQQSSNLTYRVYDYDRVDNNGNKRLLHINKAIEVINFNNEDSGAITKSKYKIKNKYFSVELYNIHDVMQDRTDGSKFFTYVFVEGEGEIIYSSNSVKVRMGEAVLIPACLGEYTIKGKVKVLKACV